MEIGGEKECLEICAIHFRDGVVEMMKSARCFIILIPCK
jgi:hypothetical protein